MALDHSAEQVCFIQIEVSDVGAKVLGCCNPYANGID